MSHTVHLSFEDIDNTVLQRLCGAFDGNLAALAKALEIDISRRFADFTFTGGNAHAGRRALLALAEAAEDLCRRYAALGAEAVCEYDPAWEHYRIG